MPKLVYRDPKYRRHSATSQAVVTLSGKDWYLGKYDTDESKRKYRSLLKIWKQRKRGKRPFKEAPSVFNPYQNQQYSSYVDPYTTYFIQADSGGLIKIGKTLKASGILKRLKDLQCGSPLKLTCIGFVNSDKEKMLHRFFADIRHHGEWFDPSPDLLDWISQNCTKFPPEAMNFA